MAENVASFNIYNFISEKATECFKDKISYLSFFTMKKFICVGKYLITFNILTMGLIFNLLWCFMDPITESNEEFLFMSEYLVFKNSFNSIKTSIVYIHIFYFRLFEKGW